MRGFESFVVYWQLVPFPRRPVGVLPPGGGSQLLHGVRCRRGKARGCDPRKAGSTPVDHPMPGLLLTVVFPRLRARVATLAGPARSCWLLDRYGSAGVMCARRSWRGAAGCNPALSGEGVRIPRHTRDLVTRRSASPAKRRTRFRVPAGSPIQRFVAQWTERPVPSGIVAGPTPAEPTDGL